MILDEKEVTNLFIFLRNRKEYRGIGGMWPHLPVKDDNFYGGFYLIEQNLSHVLSFHHCEKHYSISLSSVDLLREISSMENIILGHMCEMAILDDEIKNQISSKVDNLVEACKKPLHLKYLASKSSDALTIELATNNFSFFCQYWQSKKGMI